MSVTSYLSLYITLLGWQQYQNLWGLVVGTGLIYLPFIGVITHSIVTPFTSMGAKSAAQIALRRALINVMMGLLVIMFTALPAVHLDPKILHYDPLCDSSSTQATPGHTGTTYDSVFPVPTNVKVPIFWYFVMAFSNGITHAADDGLSCSPIDYRLIHQELNTAKIQDPNLKQETLQFYSDCYVPAYSKYLSGDLSESHKSQINEILTQYGQDDVSWLGSQVFLKVSGFYNAFQASQPIDGFPFDSSRDAEEGQVDDHSKWGEPSCTDWWNDFSSGLHERLIHILPEIVVSGIQKTGEKQGALEDVAIKTLIDHSFDSQNFGDEVRGYESLDDNTSGNYLSRYVTAPLGVVFHSFSFFSKMHLLINALPLIQGALLFSMYVFLAIAIPFSSYRMTFSIMGAFMIFSVIFCSYIWHLVQWFDNYLIQALYPDLFGVAGMGGVLSAASTYGSNVIFTNMVIGTLYLVMPIIWFVVMSWAGFQAGHALSSVLMPMSASSDAAGNAGGSLASGAVKGIVGGMR